MTGRDRERVTVKFSSFTIRVVMAHGLFSVFEDDEATCGPNREDI